MNKDGGLSSIEDEELTKNQPVDKLQEPEVTPPGVEPAPPGVEPNPPGVSQEDLTSPKKERKINDFEIKLASEVRT